MVYADTELKQENYNDYYRNFSKYHDERTGGAGGESGWESLRVEQIAGGVMRCFPDRHAKLLDAGCGRGDVLALMQSCGYTALSGMDPSATCVDRISRELKIEARQGLLSSPSYAPASFDGIILAGVLEHVLDFFAALENVAKLIRPGGKIYVEVPNAMRYCSQTLSPFQDFNLEHINHFTIHSLRNLFCSYGFDSLVCDEKPCVSDFPSEVPEVFGVFTLAQDHKNTKRFIRDSAAISSMKDYVAKSNLRIRQIDAWLRKELFRYPDILVWGTGQLTLKLLGMTALRDFKIASFVDANPIFHGRKLHGVRVSPPELIKGPPLPILIASILHASEIENRIRDQLHLSNVVIRVPEHIA